MRGKRVIMVLIIIISGLFYYNYADTYERQQNEFNVIRVIDGDTVELENSMKIRLLGINTPEKNMLLYQEAKDLLSELVLNKTIYLHHFGTDKYGRFLGYIFVDDMNVNNVMVRNGFAHLYYYDRDEYYNQLELSEELARGSELGIWGNSDNKDCIKLIELDYYDTGEDNETLVLENSCGEKLEVTIKDDATHIYKEVLENGENTFGFKNIFNDDGDSLYVWDDYGLVEFWRY